MNIKTTSKEAKNKRGIEFIITQDDRFKDIDLIGFKLRISNGNKSYIVRNSKDFFDSIINSSEYQISKELILDETTLKNWIDEEDIEIIEYIAKLNGLKCKGSFIYGDSDFLASVLEKMIGKTLKMDIGPLEEQVKVKEERIAVELMITDLEEKLHIEVNFDSFVIPLLIEKGYIYYENSIVKLEEEQEKILVPLYSKSLESENYEIILKNSEREYFLKNTLKKIKNIKEISLVYSNL